MTTKTIDENLKRTAKLETRLNRLSLTNKVSKFIKNYKKGIKDIDCIPEHELTASIYNDYFERSRLNQLKQKNIGTGKYNQRRIKCG